MHLRWTEVAAADLERIADYLFVQVPDPDPLHAHSHNLPPVEITQASCAQFACARGLRFARPLIHDVAAARIGISLQAMKREGVRTLNLLSCAARL